MTLGEFFEVISRNPSAIIFYFVSLPTTAYLATVFGRGQGHESPWKYLYSGLIYLACIPGIFAITLSVYLFLFERQPIMQTNIYTQILPIICMFLTILLIRKNVDLKLIPGFDKIGSLIFIIIILISMMWILEKTSIFVFTFMPFYQFVLLFILFMVAIRVIWNRMIKS